MSNFDTHAQPVRFLDYVLNDVQAAVLLFGHGILVNVPSPARFAIHKCVVSQMRTPGFATKASKDVQQADHLLEILATDRPGDLVLAFEAAEKMGADFLKRLQVGLDRLSTESRKAIQHVQERALRNGTSEQLTEESTR